MTTKFTLKERLRYRIDNTLARGVGMVLLWLGVLTALFVILVAVIIQITGIGPSDSSTSLTEGVWLAITRSLDPGTFSGDEGDKFRFGMLAVTLIGIFLGATIIGIISSGIDTRLETLRRGRSAVVEVGHTLIIGRSDKLSVVISELVEANRSERGRAIVVLTADDPVEVTDEIRRDVKDLGTSRLVVRSGSPTRVNDLARMNPQDAKSVIVLSPDDDTARAYLVKVVLGLNQLIPAGSATTIVAEADDEEVADALGEVVGPRLNTVISSAIVARITAQVSRMSGLGAVYQELLDFDGDEMYIVPIPERWVGSSFGQLTLASSKATIIGLERADGTVSLTVESESIVMAGDKAIGIAEDDSVFVLDRDPVPWARPADHPVMGLELARERTLIVGWSSNAQLIIKEVETHVSQGSELVILVDPEFHEAADVEAELALAGVAKQSVSLRFGSTISRPVLADVLSSGAFDHVMLLCERSKFGLDEADARVLLTLMHVRALSPDSTNNVIAELADPNDVELGHQGDSSEFIVSMQLISLLMAQLSESPHLSHVFADMFDGVGAAVAMHPAERYVPLGETDFDSVIASARNWGVVAIGYRAVSPDGGSAALAGGIRVNPSKTDRISFNAGDMIVVLVNTVK
jgi:voltage-gated potassium channel Kch